MDRADAVPRPAKPARQNCPRAPRSKTRHPQLRAHAPESLPRRLLPAAARRRPCSPGGTLAVRPRPETRSRVGLLAVRRLRDVGEHAWIAALARRLAARPADRRILVGPGDDAAAVRPGRRPLLVTTDALVENVHFRAGWAAPAALGRRAWAVTTSDLAAMGGVPRFAVLALEAPPAMRAADLDALVGGFAAAARRDGARLVGGNLAAGPHLAITAAVIGEAAGPLVTRAGARPGDRLYVTGALGAAGLAVRRLAAGSAARLPDPPRRVRAGRLLARVASAMIDVSDGLVQDVGQLCRASRVGAEIGRATCRE